MPHKTLEARRRQYKKHYAMNRDKERDRGNLKYLIGRLEALDYYSNGTLKCLMCGEDRIGCLVLDHIDGGGLKHRREVGTGQRFIAWLKKNKYPAGLRVLCANCHLLYGVNE